MHNTSQEFQILNIFQIDKLNYIQINIRQDFKRMERKMFYSGKLIALRNTLQRY